MNAIISPLRWASNMPKYGGGFKKIVSQFKNVALQLPQRQPIEADHVYIDMNANLHLVFSKEWMTEEQLGNHVIRHMLMVLTSQAVPRKSVMFAMDGIIQWCACTGVTSGIYICPLSKGPAPYAKIMQQRRNREQTKQPADAAVSSLPQSPVYTGLTNKQ